ncbi:Glycosyl transferases group 1 [Blastococcus aurantiacus]|uniref:Glycosyl transferases group 1 n=1 Tax=Blastococcus aurantiacus TaxID=1550231 RepID=A0A1G7JKT2_9ACTN|nr:glycosyltransferase [Blastococcus aurantiacus]SDF25521.1 Glycosyl transferases group 1 [Blastococcus aurantiacus]
MKVKLSSTRFAGSLYYRATEPARAVNEAGLEVQVTLSYGLATRMSGPAEDESSDVISVDADGADVVVLQLPKTKPALQILRLLQAQGVAVVVEIDDLFSGIAYGHMGFATIQHHNVAHWIAACAREADLVTATTPALLEEYARHGRGVVVPNAIPRRIAELAPAYDRPEPETVTVGWTGSLASHPYDLQAMESGLQQGLDRARRASRFTILGQAMDAQQRLHLPEPPIEVPWKDTVDEYLSAVGELFDVGIAPLRLDRFNEAKSWLKPLEYAARGVFPIRSNTPDYERLGLGMRAKRPRDWADHIAKAIDDGDRRREIAARNREVVLAQHLTEHTAPVWADAWRRALDNRVRSQRIGA